MAETCVSNYNPDLGSVIVRKERSSSPILGIFTRASRHSHPRQADLARVAGSFSSINNAFLGREVLRLVERLRAAVPSSQEAPTRRTDWTLTWGIARNTVKAQEDEDGEAQALGGEGPPVAGEPAGDHREGGGLAECVRHESAKDR
ncbi:putative homoaconitase [Rosellinia necatrix]|uniref:Putative homoaconitase n=1 Tax=Rosellinia necatrix TaxID=77044 RepID=A0A1W2TL59_ROSNE|nr:putative homoaconitase [Rosellinia necatrix]